MCLKEIGLRVQSLLINVGLVVNIIGRGNLYQYSSFLFLFLFCTNLKYNRKRVTKLQTNIGELAQPKWI